MMSIGLNRVAVECICVAAGIVFLAHARVWGARDKVGQPAPPAVKDAYTQVNTSDLPPELPDPESPTEGYVWTQGWLG